jgi:hypothetical protein
MDMPISVNLVKTWLRVIFAIIFVSLCEMELG